MGNQITLSSLEERTQSNLARISRLEARLDMEYRELKAMLLEHDKHDDQRFADHDVKVDRCVERIEEKIEHISDKIEMLCIDRAKHEGEAKTWLDIIRIIVESVLAVAIGYIAYRLGFSPP